MPTDADDEGREGQQPQQQPLVEPRVLGLACELLGRHAHVVPTMSAEALNALVSVWVLKCEIGLLGLDPS
jgi:hypothetical protein